jgi:hypothetical protein
MGAESGATTLWRMIAFCACSAIFCACAAKTTSSGANAASPPAVARPSGTTASDAPSGPRPANAEADAAYYKSQAALLAREAEPEIEHTDFARLRRGRLYLGDDAHETVTGPLEEKLLDAFEKQDADGVLATTAAILAVDQANIRAHMLRTVALRKLNRGPEADFHRAVAIGLIDSIVHSGDGHSFKTAWTVFRVKEEYEILKVLGVDFDRQSLTSDGDQKFDLLDAHDPESGQKVRVYFNISELFAEEGRELAAH